MAFENVELFDRIAEDALEKYGWQDRDESKLIVLSENATYMVRNKQNGKKDGVLRISRPGYHTLNELNSEMKWLSRSTITRLLWWRIRSGDWTGKIFSRFVEKTGTIISV